MKPLWLAGLTIGVISFATAPVRAQSVISAHSGMIHYVEGDVFLAGQKVEPKFGNFPEMKENAVLRTELGRAEVLLNPGVFLRLGENGSVRMITNRLIDTRVELVSGQAEVEADEIAKDTNVTLVCKDSTVTLHKAGVFRFDVNPAQVRVYSGEALVKSNGKESLVGGGKMVAFEGENAAVVSKFDKEDTDALSRWSRRRGQMVAMANVSAAKSLHDSGYSLYSGIWQFNPYFGMMTYIPARGTMWSPYGFQFWSPLTVTGVYYQPPPSYYGGGFDAGRPSYMPMPATSGGYSGTATSMATAGPVGAAHSGSTAAAAAPSASVGRGSGGGGGRQH